jgi:hypothetical protein
MLGLEGNGFKTKILKGDISQRTVEDSIVLSTQDEIEDSYIKHQRAKMALKSTSFDIKKRQSVQMVLPVMQGFQYHGRSLSNVGSAVTLKPFDINQTYSISAKKDKIIDRSYSNYFSKKSPKLFSSGRNSVDLLSVPSEVRFPTIQHTR